jgi:hypothetical protein
LIILYIQKFNLRKDGEFFKNFSYLPSQEGVVEFIVFVNSTNNVGESISRSRFDVRKRGPDVNTFVSVGEKDTIAIGDAFKIYSGVQSDGTEPAENVSHTIYAVQGCSFNEDGLNISSCENLTLLYENKTDFLAVGEYVAVEDLVYIPNSLGSFYIISKVGAKKDVNLRNNLEHRYVNVLKPGPNVYASISIKEVDKKVVIGDSLNISFGAESIGTEPAENVSYSLFVANDCYINEGELDLSSCENLNLLYENKTDFLAVGDFIGKEELVYTPPFPGRHYVICSVSAKEDVYPENNLVYGSVDVGLKGADLRLNDFVPERDPLIVNQLAVFNLSISNQGTEKSVGASLEVYAFTGDEFDAMRRCSEIRECDSSKRILSMPFEVNSDETLFKQFSYKPSREGGLNFVIFLNASNEIDPLSKVFVQTFEVARHGVNLQLFIPYLFYEKQMVKNEPFLFEGSIRNRGTIPASGVKVFAYTRSISREPHSPYSDEEDKNFTLLKTFDIGGLGISEEKLFNFSYTPQVKGDIGFYFNTSSNEEDVNLDDNSNYLSTFVVNNGPDLAVTYLGYSALRASLKIKS